MQGVRNETHAGRVFRVRVAGESSRALDLLRARTEIVEAMEEDGRLRVVVREDQADSGVIADVLVKNGTRLLEVREEELGLEEVFLRVTKGETQ